MRGKTGCGRLPTLPLTLFQRFPFFLPFLSGVTFLFSQPLPFLLILLPFLTAYMADRLRSRFAENPFGIIAGLELAEPFAQFGQGEISVNAGCLDRRVSHENHRAGTFADETQTDRIQSGVEFFPAGGVLDDGTSFFLRYPLCGFFARGVLKILRSGAGFDLFRQTVADNFPFSLTR